MAKLLYRGYIAHVDYCGEDDIFVGHVIGISDTLAFDGKTFEDLVRMFRETIDDYVRMCESIGKKPG